MNDDSLQVKLKNLIDNGQMTMLQIIIVAICFILNMNDGIDVLVVSFTGTEIAKEWLLSKTELGYIFSAGLAGMTAGCLFLAPIGDKIGRRKVFLISLSLISSGMVFCYFTNFYLQLLIFRFITGLGIGGILPNLAAVASEFSNKKNRDFNVGLVQAGWPVGAILTGFFAAWAIPEFGWRFAYLVAGSISILMLVCTYIFLPESLEFLAKRQPIDAHKRINNILQKMGHEKISELPPKPIISNQVLVKDLFLPEFRQSTWRLWLGVFFGMLTLYTLMSWVPTIAKDAGMPFKMATYAGTLLNSGAFLGTFTMGLLASRVGLKKMILGFMLIAFIIMLIYGNINLTYSIMFGLIFLIGFFVQGGFNGVWPTASRIYPSDIRSTGIGLATGIGRFGAILGPAAFGWFSDAGLSNAALFSIFSVPLLVMGVAIFTIPSKNVN